jgi:hypothetical protein
LRTYVEEIIPENALYHSYVDVENNYEKCEPGSSKTSKREGKFTQDRNFVPKEEKLNTQEERSGNTSTLLSTRHQTESDTHSYVSVVSSTEEKLSIEMTSSTTKAIPTTPEEEQVTSITGRSTETEVKETASLDTTVSTKRTSRIRHTIHFFENIRY